MYRRISELTDDAGAGCQREAGEGSQNTNRSLPRSRASPKHQNWNRKAKLMTLDVEDPLR